MKLLFNFIEWIICVFFHRQFGYDYVRVINRNGCRDHKKCKKCGRIWGEPCA